jgi:hypothetical protein
VDRSVRSRSVSDGRSHSRWTSHPALRVFGVVFLARDLILALLALIGVVGGGLVNQNTLSIVALALGAVLITGVVVSSIAAQRRAHAAMATNLAGTLPARRNVLRGALRERPPGPPTLRGAVTERLSSGRTLAADMRDAQEQGSWDDEGWAYRKRVEAWTERTVDLLEECGRADLARAVVEMEPPSRPPFEILLKGYSPSYARLVGLLEGRLELLDAESTI